MPLRQGPRTHRGHKRNCTFDNKHNQFSHLLFLCTQNRWIKESRRTFFCYRLNYFGPQYLTPISVEVDGRGMPKGPIQGNQLCWYGNLVYATKDLHDAQKKLLQRYVKREKSYGNENVGARKAGRALHEWCQLCGVNSENVNNMWARKTFIQTGLKDLQLPAQQIMEVSGHKCEIQMRQDYYRNIAC